MNSVRTRIAPSPTGQDLHIGNAYTALINYVFAKKNGGKFLIRIEDTDRSRLVEGSEARILASLKWLGIPHDEGPDIGGPFVPYRQSERLDSYRKYAEELVAKGHAYWCECTPQRLDQMRKEQQARHMPPMYDGRCRDLGLTRGLTIRLKVPKEGTTTFHDLIRGDIAFENKLIDDQVLLKSDGFPTYHLGVVVDDHVMEISHVIRGEEWISSTPKHILLYTFFGWDLPQFAHVSVLRNPDRSKLSKRKNPVWVSWFREQNFLPEAILNYLGTLAWAFPDGRDIFSIGEMTKEFKLENIQTTAPIFDLEKLKWFNKQYLMKKSKTDFVTLASGASGYSKEINFQNIAQGTASLIQPRIGSIAEYDSMAGFFFERPKAPVPIKASVRDLLKSTLESCEWNHEAMEKAIREAAEKANLKARDLFMELRIAVTGKSVGPPLLESMEILGKEETLSRLQNS